MPVKENHIYSKANEALAIIDKQSSDIDWDCSVRQNLIRIMDIIEEKELSPLAFKVIIIVVDSIRISNKAKDYQIDEQLNFIERTAGRFVRSYDRIEETNLLAHAERIREDTHAEIMKQRQEPESNAFFKILDKVMMPWAGVLMAGAVVFGAVEYRNHLNREAEKEPLNVPEGVAAKNWLEYYRNNKVQQNAKPANEK